MKELKINKSPGPDDLHPRLLFQLCIIIAKPLAKVYTLSLNSGLIPNDWKIANVTPLFKKSSKCECKNYRPVSLTSILCNILESIIKDSINEHLIKYDLIKIINMVLERENLVFQIYLSFIIT